MKKFLLAIALLMPGMAHAETCRTAIDNVAIVCEKAPTKFMGFQTFATSQVRTPKGGTLAWVYVLPANRVIINKLTYNLGDPRRTSDGLMWAANNQTVFVELTQRGNRYHVRVSDTRTEY